MVDEDESDIGLIQNTLATRPTMGWFTALA